MKTYYFKKGKHYSFPLVLAINRGLKKITWDIVLNEDCNYVLKDGNDISKDQYDWNKLCGAFFNKFSGRYNSAMMGWRYNIEKDEIELAAYYHVDGSRDMFKPMMTVKRKEAFSVVLHIDWQKKVYRWDMKKVGFEAFHEMPFTHQHKLCGFVNFYFGGNKSAPKRISCQIKRSIEK